MTERTGRARGGGEYMHNGYRREVDKARVMGSKPVTKTGRVLKWRLEMDVWCYIAQDADGSSSDRYQGWEIY